MSFKFPSHARFLLPILFLLLVTLTTVTPTLANSPPQSSQSEYSKLGIDATDWITSFQVTPLTSSWGIPYPDSRIWGLDPFYYDNGTITGGTGGIVAGQKQTLAFLIGGHDAGEGASAALDAYLSTGDVKYLKIFDVYFNYFQDSQIPSANVTTPIETYADVQGKNVTVFNGGMWAEQAQVAAGLNGAFGTNSDQIELSSVFPAAEHGNPIATALIAYYRLTNDPVALQMLNRYGNWLVRSQIKSGEFAGAFPVTQYYWDIGWKPRMFETTESAWILSELFILTHNQTYLDAAVAAGNFMVSRQFVNANDTHIEGALPYMANETHYSSSVSTNHAGYTLMAWTQLFRLTNDTRFLIAAERYANWLMSFQVTPTDVGWGDHTYANDSMAIGGFYYSYNTAKHKFGEFGQALSLWSASYAIPGLLGLTQLTGNLTYQNSALLAADWLTRMHFTNEQLVPLQSLAIIKYVTSSWWGRYPQFYQPNMTQIEKAGIPAFVQSVERNSSVLFESKPSWFESTFSVNFNVIDYQMASQGDTFMKMIWSHWPDLGFEPRYGGDIAFGAFSLAGYQEYYNTTAQTQQLLNQINQLVVGGMTLPENVSVSYQQAQSSLNDAEHEFQDGWYALAAAKASNASISANSAWIGLEVFIPVSNSNRVWEMERLALVGVVAILIVSNLYLFRKIKRLQGS